jgi:hypothetical protein
MGANIKEEIFAPQNLNLVVVLFGQFLTLMPTNTQSNTEA